MKIFPCNVNILDIVYTLYENRRWFVYNIGSFFFFLFLGLFFYGNKEESKTANVRIKPHREKNALKKKKCYEKTALAGKKYQHPMNIEIETPMYITHHDHLRSLS